MDPENVTELTHEETTELLLKAWESHENLLDMLRAAWEIIADANSKPWAYSAAWKEAVARWRDEYYKLLQEETLPEEDEAEDPIRTLSSREVWELVEKEKKNV